MAINIIFSHCKFFSPKYELLGKSNWQTLNFSHMILKHLGYERLFKS